MSIRQVTSLVLTALLCTGCTADPSNEEPADASGDGTSGWTALFNGEDLTGWTPKIRGIEAGEDPYHTFRVEDGLLTVSYAGDTNADAYGPFDERFGHLFYGTPFSHYQLRVEYRFVGEQAEGGPDWALRNSGAMLHAQSAESMLADQDFPVSIEAQFLGGDGTDERATANLCTPGTHVDIGGVFTEAHCINSTSPTFHGEAWVTVDLWVRGHESIVHAVNGDTVLVYEHPVVGGGVVTGFDPVAKPDGTELSRGYIALQSESHPVQFRKVLLRDLDPGA
jgi:hypothetical protein